VITFDLTTSSAGAGYGEDFLVGLAPPPPPVPHDDFLGARKSDFLIESSSGVVQVGQVGSNGKVAYAPLTSLTTTWLFVGSGDYIQQGHDQFLIENTGTNGIDLGQVSSSGQVTLSRVSTPTAGWEVVGSGDYLGLGLGHDQFLLENPSGAVDIGQVGANKIATLTPFATLGAWTVVASGDFLGEGHDQFLMENASGLVYIGQESGGEVVFHSFAKLGTTWKIVGVGDYLGEGHDQFLMGNASGALYTADDGPGRRTSITASPRWRRVGRSSGRATTSAKATTSSWSKAPAAWWRSATSPAARPTSPRSAPSPPSGPSTARRGNPPPGEPRKVLDRRVAQASIPTRQGSSPRKNFSTSARRSFFLTTTCPPASTPWIWKMLLARSRPIVVIGMVDGSCWRLLRQRPPYGAQTLDTGAVHPIRANRIARQSGRNQGAAPPAGVGFERASPVG
jgi:hypothetical protein